MINDVGTRMLVLRKLNGWSQRQLAKRAGVPHSAISMIEHGQVSPSVNSLQKVLDGVPMTLADFFCLDLNQTSQIFFHSGSLKTESHLNITRTFLSASSSDGDSGIVMSREQYLPGSDTGEEMLNNDGIQMGFLVQGQLEMTVGGDIEKLHEGDAFQIPRRRPYRFRNTTEQASEIIKTTLPDTER